MEINIRLSKANKKLLKQLVLGIFHDVKKIKIKQDTAILKRGIFKKNKSIKVAELILIEIPYYINKLGDELEMGETFPYFNDINESIEYFEDTEDVIEHLYSTYSILRLSYTLDSEFDDKSRTLPNIEVVESKKTKRVFVVTVDNYRERIDEVINISEFPLKVIHIRKDSEVRGPPGQQHQMILEKVA